MKTVQMSHFTKAATMIAAGHAHHDTRVAVCSDRTRWSPVVYFVLSADPIHQDFGDIRDVKLRLHAEMTRLAPDATEFYFEDENITHAAEIEDCSA